MPATTTTSRKRSPRAETRHVLSMLLTATEADLVAGVSWYAQAELMTQALSTRYGVTRHVAAAVIAALSPNNRWERNCADAEAMIAAWADGIDPETVKVCTYGLNRAKAARILAADDQSPTALAAILNGRKVTAFYWNISGDHNHVTVDGHAYAIWRGQRITTTTTPSIGAKLYETISRAYCLAAGRSAELCGHKLTPAQVQAVTWVTYRRIHGIG